MKFSLNVHSSFAAGLFLKLAIRWQKGPYIIILICQQSGFFYVNEQVSIICGMKKKLEECGQ